MAITKRPPAVDPRKVDAFISGAPDAKVPASAAEAKPAAPIATKAAAPSSPRKHPISLTIAPDLLGRIDETAARLGLSRAAAIALACSRFVEAERKGG
jgi:hypothetical protein